VRVWQWKDVIAGSRSSSSSSSSSPASFASSSLTPFSRLAGLDFWDASKMPRLPILSPAKTSCLSDVGWKPREYIRSGVILIRLGSKASYSSKLLICSRSARSSLSVVFLTSVSPNVRSYGLAPRDTTSTKKFSFLSQSFPATTTSPRSNGPDCLCFFTLAASCTATYSSSAFRLATSLSAVSPWRRDDVLLGPASSCLIRLTGPFFLWEELLFGADLAFWGPRPACPASRASCFSSLSRWAMFACRCCSYSLSSRAMLIIICVAIWDSSTLCDGFCKVYSMGLSRLRSGTS